MPHKRNPDLFELTRAREAVLAGCLAQTIAIAGKLPGGYHRDLQMLKAPLMTALDTAREMAATMAMLTCAYAWEGQAITISFYLTFVSCMPNQRPAVMTPARISALA